MRVSVVIPTLNEERALGALLGRLRGVELIVVDGGSGDATVQVAHSYGARVVEADACRGRQLHAGALAAAGDVLWFLHADALPAPRWMECMQETLADQEAPGGYFRVCFDGGRAPARFLTRFYSGVRKAGLIYGDAGIFVRRSVYEQSGGFKPLPLFEDLDFVRRIKLFGGLRPVGCVLVLSSRRWEGRSFAWAFARWMSLQALYWIGVPPAVLARRYEPVRERARAAGQG